MNLASCFLILLQTEVLIRPDYLMTAIIFLCGLMVALLAAMLLMLILKNRRALRRRQLQQQFQDWLIGIVLAEKEEQQAGFAVPGPIGLLLGQDFARRQLLLQITQAKASLSGLPADNLVALYRQLGLDRVSAASLQRRRWHRVAQGIQQLAMMHQTDYAPQIAAFANHRHPVVRMEAQIALVMLQHYQGLGFLQQLRYPLTQWQ